MTKKIKIFNSNVDGFKKIISKSYVVERLNDNEEAVKTRKTNQTVSYSLKPQEISFEGDECVIKQKMTVLNKGYNRTPRFQREMEGIFTNSGIEYHKTTFIMPQEANIEDSQNLNSGFYKIEPILNWLKPLYEKTFKNYSERELPNFYTSYTNQQNSNYFYLNTFNVPSIRGDFLKNLTKSKKNKIFVRPAELTDMYKEIYIDDDYNISANLNSLEEFPYYTSLRFSINDTSESDSFLHEIKFKNLFDLETVSFAKEDVLFNVQKIQKDKIQVDANVPVPVIDVMEMIKKGTFDSPSNKIVLPQNTTKFSAMSKKFKRLMSYGFFKNLCKKNLKNYNNIINNEDCKTDLLYYRIDKYLNTVSGDPLQTYYVSGKKEFNMVDTQVKKDTTYVYNLKAAYIVYGAKYHFEDLSFDKRNPNLADVTIVCKPSFKIVEMDVATKNVKIVDRPLGAPYIKFINSSNATNKVKIYLDLNFDSEYIKQPGVFEIYRMDKKPESIKEFDNFSIATVKNQRYSTSANYNDYILPNKKYFYIAKAINTSGIHSEATSVFEVELLKSADTSKIDVKTIQLHKEPVYLNKNFMRLLQVSPAYIHTVIDEEDKSIQNLKTFRNKVNEIPLGMAEDKIWGKKFKIRVRSNDSGKILDLNVKFNLIKNKTKEDF